MEENPPPSHQFKVHIKDVRVHSATEVLERGMLPTSITFHLDPLGDVGTPSELQRNLIGEDLDRAIRLQKSGSAIVEVSSNWWVQHSRNWREEIIGLALQQLQKIAPKT
jgi:hypothetical protein